MVNVFLKVDWSYRGHFANKVSFIWTPAYPKVKTIFKEACNRRKNKEFVIK